MRNYTRVLVVILSILMIVSITACGSGSTVSTTAGTGAVATAASTTTEAAVKEPVKLKAFLLYEDADRKALHDKYYSVNVKTDLPDFDVEFEVPGQGYADKLKIYNASGDMPDVYWGSTLCIDSGNSLDLTDVIKKDGFYDKYTNKGALIPYKNGKIYSISSGTDSYFTPVVFYYKDIFAKEGISIPKTIDEFVAAGKALKAKGYIPLTAPGPWVLCETFMQDLMLGIDPTFPTKIISGNAKFSDPISMQAFGELKQMVDAGMFPTNMATIDYGGGMQLFKDKKAAMVYVPTWELSGLSADTNVDFFGLPGTANVDTNKNINIWGAAQNGFSVFTHSKHTDEAVKLAEWLVSQDAKYFVTEKKNKIGFDAGVPLTDVSPLMQKSFDRVDGATDSKTAVMALSGATDSTFQTYMGKFLTKQIPAEEFAKALDDSFAKNDK